MQTSDDLIRYLQLQAKHHSKLGEFYLRAAQQVEAKTGATMPILPAQTQAIAELGDIFYSYLPGSGAKYTWKEAAEANGVGFQWMGGSKRPSIVNLFEKTFEFH